MSQHLPNRIDPRRYADAGRVLEGSRPMRGMARLAESAILDDGSVEVVLRFERDLVGHRLLHGEITATVELLCQRCLEPYRHDLHSHFVLAFIKREAEADELPDEYEPVVLEEEGELTLDELIEDELLLSLPIVAMHPLEACPAAGLADSDMEPETVERKNPFALLAQLKPK